MRTRQKRRPAATGRPSGEPGEGGAESNAQHLWIGLTEGGTPSRWSDRQVIELGRRCGVGREGTPVLTVVNEDGSTPYGASLLDEIVREGARRMPATAPEAGVNVRIAELTDQREAWAGLLRGCARRGIRAPMLAVGDGALGFWKALGEVLPETREQRASTRTARRRDGKWTPHHSVDLQGEGVAARHRAQLFQRAATNPHPGPQPDLFHELEGVPPLGNRPRPHFPIVWHPATLRRSPPQR
jgi:hypothetical protein